MATAPTARPGNLDLAGRTAIVTGANHGIGAATATRLAGAGAAVVVAFLRTDEPSGPGIPEQYGRDRRSDAAWVVNVIRAGGGRAIAVEADLADEAAPSAVFGAAEEAFGPVDILINNASAWLADTFKTDSTDRLGRSLERVSSGTFHRQFAVDARATALMIAEFAHRHERHGLSWGRIISLTSGGPLGMPEEVSYGAAKAALENYTMSAAFELADRGITANVVHPPVTDTGWVTDEVRAAVRDDAGLFRVAEPGEVADVIVLLASSQASPITANIIRLH